METINTFFATYPQVKRGLQMLIITTAVIHAVRMIAYFM